MAATDYNFNANLIRIYVGTDRSQMLGVKVLEYSIAKHTNHPFKIYPLLLDLPEPNNKINVQRTGFSFSRFAIPELAGYQGKAIYMDADMLVFGDIKNLWDIPFNGAKILVQGEIPQNLRNKYHKKKFINRTKQSSVSLLDCSKLDWDVNEIIAGLDSRYNYNELMNHLCILNESDIGYRIPFEWNSLEYWDNTTCNLHYTDMNTQPWVSPSNMFGYLWLNELKEMLLTGNLNWSDLEREVDLGYARPSILHELKNSGSLKPNDKREIILLKRIDKRAGYKMHKEAIKAAKKRKIAEIRYCLEKKVDCTYSAIRNLLDTIRLNIYSLRMSAEITRGKDISELRRELVKNCNNSARLSVLVVFDLIQDLEVMKPLIRDLADNKDIRLKALVSNWLQNNSHRVSKYLQTNGMDFSIFNTAKLLRDNSLPFLDTFDYVLLPSESNLRPHKVSHHIANVASKKNIQTITFQHGLENIGLTYFDDKVVDIASKVIITWNDTPRHEPRIKPHIRRKCMGLGMFKETSSDLDRGELRKVLGYSKIIGIFENLHWERYSKKYKEEFLNALEWTAKSKDDVALLVKPHHAGRWLNLHHKKLLKHLKNVTLINVKDRFWEQYTGNQLVNACDMVITTPSTIAIDAALASTPVAIVANDLADLGYYEPLDFLFNSRDWINYIDAVLYNPRYGIDRVDEFLSRNVLRLNPSNMFIKEVLKLGEINNRSSNSIF